MLYKLVEDMPVEYKLNENEKIILCGVPGPFTPGCSKRHLPGFAENLDKLTNKGITKVAFVAVSNAYVMDAWNKQYGHEDIDCIGDPYGEFIESINELTENSFLAKCSNRFSVLVEDGKITKKFSDPFFEGVYNEL